MPLPEEIFGIFSKSQLLFTQHHCGKKMSSLKILVNLLQGFVKVSEIVFFFSVKRISKNSTAF